MIGKTNIGGDYSIGDYIPISKLGNIFVGAKYKLDFSDTYKSITEIYSVSSNQVIFLSEDNKIRGVQLEPFSILYTVDGSNLHYSRKYKVFITGTGTIKAYNAVNGSQIWSKALTGNMIRNACDEDNIFTFQENQTVTDYNILNGQVIKTWSNITMTPIKYSFDNGEYKIFCDIHKTLIYKKSDGLLFRETTPIFYQSTASQDIRQNFSIDNVICVQGRIATGHLTDYDQRVEFRTVPDLKLINISGFYRVGIPYKDGGKLKAQLMLKYEYGANRTPRNTISTYNSATESFTNDIEYDILRSYVSTASGRASLEYDKDYFYQNWIDLDENNNILGRGSHENINKGQVFKIYTHLELEGVEI